MAQTTESRKKVLLLSVLFAGLLAYGGNAYVYAPRKEAVAEMEKRVERLRAQNRTARKLTEEEGRADAERRLTRYRDQLVQVEGLIPSSEELPDLLDAISAEAQRTGVDLALIQPVGATAEQFYTRRTYDLAVLGTYHQIGAFLTEIASLRRIITPINLNLSVRSEEAGGVPRLEAKFAIETYILPPPDQAAADAAAAQ
jgi:type IV pilus assembly protein PilO